MSQREKHNNVFIYESAGKLPKTKNINKKNPQGNEICWKQNKIKKRTEKL